MDHKAATQFIDRILDDERCVETLRRTLIGIVEDRRNNGAEIVDALDLIAEHFDEQDKATSSDDYMEVS